MWGTSRSLLFLPLYLRSLLSCISGGTRCVVCDSCSMQGCRRRVSWCPALDDWCFWCPSRTGWYVGTRQTESVLGPKKQGCKHIKVFLVGAGVEVGIVEITFVKVGLLWRLVLLQGIVFLLRVLGRYYWTDGLESSVRSASVKQIIHRMFMSNMHLFIAFYFKKPIAPAFIFSSI